MKRIILLLTCLVVALVLVTSCAPTTTPTTNPPSSTTTAPPVTTTKPPTTTTAPPATTTTTAGKPQYGGTINLAIGYDPASFDPADGNVFTEYFATCLIYEKMLIGDWTKGPAGTKESPFTHFWHVKPYTGHLCESWERPDLNTCIWHLRKGIKFQNIPPVNGREMTADDVVYSILRLKASPKVAISYYGNVISAVAKDKYTVEIKLKDPDAIYHVTTGTGSVCMVFPKEMVDKYGNLNSWQSACGTGPWIIKDYVNASALTFKKNPDYWHKDPLNPSNSLPYADGVNEMIIPDNSTRIAGLRTGKIDYLVGSYQVVNWQDSAALKKSNPELQSVGLESSTGILGMCLRVDKPPLNDKKVRQALSMAIDHQGLVNSYLGGNGIIINKPEMKMWGESVYTPMEKLPEAVRKIYEYHPDEAKKLLAEAGYPQGFKIQIITAPVYADLMALVKDWWSKIGVEANIVTKDQTSVSAMVISIPRQWDGIIVWRNGSASPERVWGANYLEGATWNVCNIQDKHINEMYLKIYAEPDDAKRDAMVKELNVYALEQCYYIDGPSELSYNFWQPWIKNNYGATFLDGWGLYRGLMYTWIDKDTKK